jgi:hypothetical protein
MRAIHFLGIVLVALFVAVPSASAGGSGHQCTPAGSWWGYNISFEQEYMFSIVNLGGGKFSAVGDGGANYGDLFSETYEKSTDWRGPLVRIGPKTYELNHLVLASPSLVNDPALGLPDVLGAHGILTMIDCDHFEVQYDSVPLWAWGQTPWVDDPIDDFGAGEAFYTRIVEP